MQRHRDRPEAQGPKEAAPGCRRQGRGHSGDELHASLCQQYFWILIPEGHALLRQGEMAPLRQRVMGVLKIEV